MHVKKERTTIIITEYEKTRKEVPSCESQHSSARNEKHEISNSPLSVLLPRNHDGITESATFRTKVTE